MENKDYYESAGKALLSLVPCVGGAVTSFISDVQAARKEERYKEFLKYLTEEVDKIKYKLRDEYVGKEDFADMFEKTSQYVINDWSKNRRKAYRNIFLNSMVFENVSYDKTEEYLRIVNELSELEIAMLSVFNDPVGFYEENGVDYNNTKKPAVLPQLEKNPMFSTDDAPTKQFIPMVAIISKILDIPLHEISNSIYNLSDKRLITLGDVETSIIKHFSYSKLENRLTIKGKEFVAFILDPQ